MERVLRRLIPAALVVCLAVAPVAPDPFIWLESVSSPRATAWVAAENKKTLAVLQNDRHFKPFLADAVAVNSSSDRIPTPDIIGGRVYNFWQDATHVRGIWRSTTIADYAGASPSWTTVLDLDAVAKSEGKNWVWEGADCLSPSQQRCLISLSDGGEDAQTIREFDLPSASFVSGGFVLPHAKQEVGWIDADTILVARPWNGTDVTASGYAYIAKSVKRGQPLSAATEVMRGTPSDVQVEIGELADAQGRRVIFTLDRVSFFETTIHVLTPDGLRTLAVPRKSTIHALAGGRLVMSLEEPWTIAGRTLPIGALVALDLAATLADPAHLAPSLVYAPGPREAFENAVPSNGGLIVTTLENVSGRATMYSPTETGWTHRAITLPDLASVSAVGLTDPKATTAYMTVSSFLSPNALVQVDTATGATTTVKQLTAKFDASKDVVEQQQAISSDGTRIPYFIVHPKTMAYDGRNPTIINAYGGFDISETPRYSGTIGKLWLEPGGVFVLANIRGGGEFGPAWHEAGLTTNRQRIYDDFSAVARDLIAKKITQPRNLGIVGGSNGGLLMGVEFTQHPELYHAVDIEVPLLDMLRFEQIAAGASWVGEYGSVSIPAERAFLAKISPYNNIKPGVHYPEPFIWTTTKDDRVGPQHARKFAAKLGAMHIPYFFYEVTEGGHGAGANINEKSFTSALEYTYFTRALK